MLRAACAVAVRYQAPQKPIGSNPDTIVSKKPLDFKLLQSARQFFWRALFLFIKDDDDFLEFT